MGREHFLNLRLFETHNQPTRLEVADAKCKYFVRKSNDISEIPVNQKSRNITDDRDINLSKNEKLVFVAIQSSYPAQT